MYFTFFNQHLLFFSLLIKSILCTFSVNALQDAKPNSITIDRTYKAQGTHRRWEFKVQCSLKEWQRWQSIPTCYQLPSSNWRLLVHVHKSIWYRKSYFYQTCFFEAVQSWSSQVCIWRDVGAVFLLLLWKPSRCQLTLLLKGDLLSLAVSCWCELLASYSGLHSM